MSHDETQQPSIVSHDTVPTRQRRGFTIETGLKRNIVDEAGERMAVAIERLESMRQVFEERAVLYFARLLLRVKESPNGPAAKTRDPFGKVEARAPTRREQFDFKSRLPISKHGYIDRRRPQRLNGTGR